MESQKKNSQLSEEHLSKVRDEQLKIKRDSNFIRRTKTIEEPEKSTEKREETKDRTRDEVLESYDEENEENRHSLVRITSLHIPFTYKIKYIVCISKSQFWFHTELGETGMYDNGIVEMDPWRILGLVDPHYNSNLNSVIFFRRKNIERFCLRTKLCWTHMRLVQSVEAMNLQLIERNNYFLTSDDQTLCICLDVVQNIEYDAKKLEEPVQWFKYT